MMSLWKRAFLILFALIMICAPLPKPGTQTSAAMAETLGIEYNEWPDQVSLTGVPTAILFTVMEGKSALHVKVEPGSCKGMSEEEIWETLRASAYMWCSQGWNTHVANEDGSLQVWYSDLRFRDGVRLAFYTDDLTEDEKRCRDEIDALVAGFAERCGGSQLAMEVAIYDYIRAHMTYRSFEDFPAGDPNSEKCTSAVTAFREGWGNCQAYSDLFYLMAQCAGIESYFVSGKTMTGGRHLWNCVEFTVGEQCRNYMVDVTWGDNLDIHYYLNFGLDRCGDRIWYTECNVAPVTDDRHTYYSAETSDMGKVCRTYKEIAEFCVWKAKRGYKAVELLLTGFSGVDKDKLNNAITRALPNHNRKREWNWHPVRMDDAGNIVLKFTWAQY